MLEPTVKPLLLTEKPTFIPFCYILWCYSSA